MALVSYITYVLDDGTSLNIETSDTGGGEAFTSRASEMVTRQFDESLVAVRKAARAVLDALREAEPDEVKVEFSLKASFELGGLMVAKSSGEGAYSVTLKWKRNSAED
jgi:hypothetical protein